MQASRYLKTLKYVNKVILSFSDDTWNMNQTANKNRNVEKPWNFINCQLSIDNP